MNWKESLNSLVKFCRALEAKALTLFDWKELIKLAEKMTDVTDEKVEEYRIRHKSYFNNELTEVNIIYLFIHPLRNN